MSATVRDSGRALKKYFEPLTNLYIPKEGDILQPDWARVLIEADAKQGVLVGLGDDEPLSRSARMPLTGGVVHLDVLDIQLEYIQGQNLHGAPREECLRSRQLPISKFVIDIVYPVLGLRIYVD